MLARRLAAVVTFACLVLALHPIPSWGQGCPPQKGADVRFRRAKQAELLHGGERIFLAEFLSDVPVLQTKNGGAGEVHFPT